MATIKVQLKKHYKKDDGTYPIVFYVYEVKPQYIYTGYSVKEDQFKDGQVLRKHPDAVIINARIEDQRTEIVASIIPGVGYIKGMKPNPVYRSNFCEYLRKRANQFKQSEQIDFAYKCDNLAQEMVDIKGRDVYSGEIDMDFIRLYVASCKAIPNSHNTVMGKLKNLSTLYNQAVGEGLASLPNPFDYYERKLEPVSREKLNMSQIKSLEQLQLPIGATSWHVRNAFLLSFYCQGMRFESVCMLSWQHIRADGIYYQMNKGKKWRRLEIHQKLQGILDLYTGNQPYVLPFFKEVVQDRIHLRRMKGSASAIANEYLKIIGNMAGIPYPITFHIARHTFAYLAKTKGVSTDLIKDALGHSDMKTTEGYLKSLDDSHINEAVRSVWE
jgi:integrase